MIPRRIHGGNLPPGSFLKRQFKAIQDTHSLLAPHIQSGLATSHHNIGLSLSETGKPAEALAAYESALAIRRKLAQEHPESPDFASAGEPCTHSAIMFYPPAKMAAIPENKREPLRGW